MQKFIFARNTLGAFDEIWLNLLLQLALDVTVDFLVVKAEPNTVQNGNTATEGTDITESDAIPEDDT